MLVTIWDLDYYYAKNRRNCYNVDAMKISSYHKQRGDKVNFVQNEYDIRRPYDLYYIIKENPKTPNPPLDFFSNRMVMWWGKAYLMRHNWKMSVAMLACRPDYLLYPEKNTRQERAEYIRLFDDDANLLPISQDYSNSFKNKDSIVTDPCMWKASKENIIKALDILKTVKNVSFSEPIDVNLLICDKDIRDYFFDLKFTSRSKITFMPVPLNEADAAVGLVAALYKKFGTISYSVVQLKYDISKHWDDPLAAIRDFEKVKDLIVKGKVNGVRVVAAKVDDRMETPFYHLFEELNKWTSKYPYSSWFTYLRNTHKNCNIGDPATWDGAFRDLVRQTYKDKDFFLTGWKTSRDSENEIPWAMLDKEFRYGI